MTSRDVYNRILWDHRIDASKVTVGYEDRFRGVVELGFQDGKLGGDVPWHRVQFFTFEGRRVWDRQGLDLLHDILSAETSGKTYLHPSEEPLSTPPGPLKLLTWNVLFDLYDREVPRFKTRLPGILELLKRENADVVALQEVTPEFGGALLKDEWISETYHSSPADALNPYGQLLLSRYPGYCDYRALQAGKSLLSADLGFLKIGVVHLFSDRADDAESRRRKQLDEVLESVSGDTVLMGDFNIRGVLKLPEFRDVWGEVCAGERGLTFDALRNPLAAHTSRKQTRARFDRIFVRGSWTVQEASVLQETELSDHQPLLANLTPPPVKPRTHQSALCIIPPKELWPPIQEIRRDHDKSFHRWMPHINLLYGFLPESEVEDVRRIAAPLFAQFPRFTVKLREFKRFQHKKSTTVWLRPESSGVLVELQALLQSRFPNCNDRSDFTPHLTVASIAKGKKIPNLPPVELEFEVSAVDFITRGAQTPFEVKDSFELATPIPEPPVVKMVLPEELAGLTYHLVGSSGLGLELPGSDIDVVVEEDWETARRVLPDWEAVEGRVPLLRSGDVELQCGSMQSLRDLQYLQSHHDIEALRPFLRLVRWWTKRRALDRALYGFPGGFAWALLAAGCFEGRPLRVELAEFFEFLSEWPWPEPYLLNPESRFEVRERDRFPIITPTEPFSNAALNVTPGTLETVLQEARRGWSLARAARWDELFEELAGGEELEVSDRDYMSFLLTEEREGRRVRPVSRGRLFRREP